MRRLALVLAACGAASFPAAAAADTAAAIRIARIRNIMAENLERLPNYTCTQTIERTMRPARGRRFQLIDTLRLEVALVKGKELFAWPGSGKFDDRDLSEIVGGGASGNGNFGLHARAIFLSSSARFEYLGQVETEERQVFRYAYHVPLLQSGYMLRIGRAEGVAGYRGFFEADTSTLDIVSLDVIADDEIPPHLPVKRAHTRMLYRRMEIGSGQFLLPEGSEMTITDFSGHESRNLVQLSGCKQYGTESTISFDEPPPATTEPAPAALPASSSVAAAARNVVAGELPLGLVFDVSLETSLAFPGAAIGDLVEGRLASDAKRKGIVMVPKGTPVRGRLLRFGPLANARVPSLGLVIRLFEIDLPGGRAEIHAVPERVLPMGAAGTRLSVDNGVIYITSGSRRELPRGSRVWWRLEQPEPEKR